MPSCLQLTTACEKPPQPEHSITSYMPSPHPLWWDGFLLFLPALKPTPEVANLPKFTFNYACPLLVRTLLEVTQKATAL